MDLTKENKAQIDSLPYETLLADWRFARVGDKWFQGETGKYWAERMRELREKGADHVATSKAIGWAKEG